MSRRCYSFYFLLALVVFCTFGQGRSIPKTKTSSAFNFVLHDEYLGFGQWVDDENYPMEDTYSVLANKQLQLRCFQELRQDKSRTHNSTGGFYVSTVDKFDTLYGTWKIRAKLPSSIQATLMIALMESHCRPPKCPPTIRMPATVMMTHPTFPSRLEFSVMYWDSSNNDAQAEMKTSRKLPKYGDSFHTYEIHWRPTSLEWRIDGKVVAGFFDTDMVPRERMALHLYAFCDTDLEQSFDENSGLTISSIEYRAYSKTYLGRFTTTSSTRSTIPPTATEHTIAPTISRKTLSSQPKNSGNGERVMALSNQRLNITTVTSEVDILLHDEYLYMGGWADGQNYPIGGQPPNRADRKLQVRCFEELRQDKSQRTVSDGFYVSTAGKLDMLYGTLEFRAKLPSSIQSSMRIALTSSHCKPPACPPGLDIPAIMMRLYPARPSEIEFSVTFDGIPDHAVETTRILRTYQQSYHTYELIWLPNRVEWRIDGKSVAEFSIYEMVPHEPMALHLAAFCSDAEHDGGAGKSFDEDSGIKFSSIVYTPLSLPSPDRLKINTTMRSVTPRMGRSTGKPASSRTRSRTTTIANDLEERAKDEATRPSTGKRPVAVDSARKTKLEEQAKAISEAIKNILMMSNAD